MYHRHQKGVWRVVRRYISHDADADVTQQVFVRTFKGLAAFRGAASVRSWLSSGGRGELPGNPYDATVDPLSDPRPRGERAEPKKRPATTKPCDPFGDVRGCK